MQSGRQSKPGVHVTNPLCNLKNKYYNKEDKDAEPNQIIEKSTCSNSSDMDYLASNHKKSRKQNMIWK